MMSDKNIHNNEQDVFSQRVKQKLENHRTPVDDDVWKGIQQRMDATKKRNIPLWYWISGGIAAAIALLLLIYPLSNQKVENTIAKNHQQAETVPTTIKPTQTTVSVEQPASHPEAKSAVGKGSNLAKRNTFAKPTQSRKLTIAENVGTKKTANTKSNEIPSQQEQQTTTLFTKNEKEKKEHQIIVADAVQKTESKPSAVTQTEPKNETPEITSLPDLNDYPEFPVETKKPKRKQKTLLAAAFSTAGSMPQLKGTEDLVYAGAEANKNLVSDAAMGAYALNNNILRATDYTHARHEPPMSFGVTLEKSLDEHWGIESGLVYTYLRSTFTRSGDANYKGTLHLHYLGIPLNVRARLWSKPTWDVYVSLGGMIEKGLRSIYNQEIDKSSSTANTQVKSGVDGVQWSLNGAIGVDYKLNKDLSLFLEPKVTYYLENNQPMSARTEHPLNLGIGGGLRIGL